MNHPKVCMVLTGKTLEENVRLVHKYEKVVDIVELRVDYLNEDEQLYVRRFPALIHKPCILVIRRDIDGGFFTGSEFSRTNLFGRALAFANQDKAKNFAYVDFEEDYQVPSIQDAAQAFGVRIIRSYCSPKEPVYNLKERCDKMRKTGIEIPKIVFKPNKLSDVVNIFKEGSEMTDYDHILCAYGPEGLPSRILASKSNSYLTYVAPEEFMQNNPNLGYVDPVSLANLYSFKNINEETALYGITGKPVGRTAGPEIHNTGYKRHDLNAVFFPVQSNLVSEALNFAENLKMKGLVVTNPHKESVLYYLNESSPTVVQTGCCNTVIRNGNRWFGYNTDAIGFKKALEDFLGTSKLRWKKVALLGAGSAAKTVAYALKQMGARVCIFNRNVSHARQLAEKYGFEYCNMEEDCVSLLDEYSYLIIQATSVGMASEEIQEKNDPIPFYNFRGDELLFDVVFKPAITPLMKRASLSGCRVCNGYKMLEYKAYEQYKLFTGLNYENDSKVEDF